MATSSQGISYHPNIWHHPLIALDTVRPLASLRQANVENRQPISPVSCTKPVSPL